MHVKVEYRCVPRHPHPDNKNLSLNGIYNLILSKNEGVAPGVTVTFSGVIYDDNTKHISGKFKASGTSCGIAFDSDITNWEVAFGS